MPRLAVLFLILISALPGSCRSAGLSFRSAVRTRAIEIADTIDSNVAQFQIDRPGIIADAELCTALTEELCDRILTIDVRRREIEIKGDAALREMASQQSSRYRMVVSQLGETAARVFVQMANGSGYRVSLALDSLAKMEDAAVAPALLEAFQSADSTIRRAALRAAATSPSRIVNFQSETALLLLDPDWTVRREACVTLGQSKLSGEKWDDALAEAMNDPQPLVASEAARALGTRKSLQRINTIIEFLERARNANDPLSAEAAHAALAEITNRKDMIPDPVAWRKWVEENRPESRPAP
ncbi:MAG: HEAT repeat domain-containing protein [Planctomycetota bacterium]